MYISYTISWRKHSHSKKRRNGIKQAKTQPMHDWITAGQTPNPVVPCLGSGALGGIIWAAAPLGCCSPLVLVPTVHIDSLLTQLNLMPTVLGAQSPLLACPISWGLHCNLGFTFSASCSLNASLRGVWPDTPTYCLASVASRTLVLTSVTPLFLCPQCLQNQCHLENASKLCCQIKV